MKQKKNAAPAAKKNIATPAVPAEVVSNEYTRKDTVMIVLFSVLLFLAMTVQTGRMTMVLTGVALAAALPIGKDMVPRLRRRFCVPVIGLLAFALMQGLAAIYSPFDSYAVKEYYKFLAAFALAVILLVRFDKKHVRGLLWGLVAVCSVIALLCIDMGGSQLLFRVFNAFIRVLGGDFSSALENSQVNRINGIYNDANITGALMGITVSAALYLVYTAKNKGQKIISCVLLGVSVVSFLVAVSRGAMLCFGVAAMAYLVFEKKENRLRLFFLMLSTGIAVVITGIPAMMRIGHGSVVPDILALLCGVVIYVLDCIMGEHLVEIVQKHGVLLAGGTAAALLLVVGLGVLAFRTTEPFVFDQTERLTRAVRLSPGDYTVSGDWSDASTDVLIYAKTPEDALTGDRIELYKGNLKDASFTVPDGVGKVVFRFVGTEGERLNTVELSDGTEVPMAYSYIPELIARRLQNNLFEDSSFLLRVQYLKDGWKIFRKAPVAGHGLGASEGLLTSVQPFFYESKFLHCHILQVLTDMGIVGAMCFMTYMLGLAWTLLRALKSEERSLAAMLLAGWVMMNVHSLMEINFSIRGFMCLAYAFLAVAIVAFEKPLSEKMLKIGGWILGGFIWLYLTAFGGLLMSHRMVESDAAAFATSDVDVFMHSLSGFVDRDAFVQEDNKLMYVANAVQLGDSRYDKTMQKYVKDLRDLGTYTACTGLARYYYLPQKNLEEVFACSREGIAQEASANDAWNYQFEFYWQEVLPVIDEEQIAVFVDGVQETSAYLETFSENRYEEIALTRGNRHFIEAVEQADESNMPDDAVLVHLLVAAEEAALMK